MPRTRWSAAACMLLFAVGCGPITSTTAIADATVALEAAEAANAEKFAVYEYTMAQECLRKAKEEEGYSEYQPAIDLAKKARKFAEKAKELSVTSPSRDLPRASEGDHVSDQLGPASGERL